MYDIPYLKAPYPEDGLAYVQEHPFAMLCGADMYGKPVATHVPLLFEKRGDRLYLMGHEMKKRDHANAFLQNPNALVIYSRANTYISASWYENNKMGGTWNYRSVQVTGTIQFRDEDFPQQFLIRLTEKLEAPISTSRVQHMDPDYVQQMIQAAMAFEVEVHSIRHVSKLNQNRDTKSQANIIFSLNKKGENAREVARAIERNNKTKS
jgi:transcriptional regulator